MTIANSLPTDDLLRRICAEYTEMPGLRVTCEQAQRLWGLDASMCREVLECLVHVRFLTLTATRQYVRLTEGATTPDLQMARATLDKRAGGRHADQRAG